MNPAQIYRRLFRSDSETHSNDARKCLEKKQELLALWHFDAIVRKHPERASEVAHQCATLERPGLAKRYSKKAVQQTSDAAQGQELWQLGQRYMEIAAQRTQRDKQRKFVRPWQQKRHRECTQRGLQAFLRAEAASPSAYGPHASRLRVLLDQIANDLFERPWRKVSQALAANESVEHPNCTLLDEALRELVATQTLMPYPDELIAVGQLLMLQGDAQVQATIETLVLPLLHAFLFNQHASGRPHDPAMASAALTTLGHLATQTWAASEVRCVLREFCEADRVSPDTLPAWVFAYHALAMHDKLADGLGEDLLLLLSHSSSPEVKDQLHATLEGDVALQKPQSTKVRKLVSHLVVLDKTASWESTPLGHAVSDDGVLNLDRAQVAQFAQCDPLTQGMLLRRLTPAQKRILAPESEA